MARVKDGRSRFGQTEVLQGDLSTQVT